MIEPGPRQPYVRDRAFAIAAICTLQEIQPEDASPSNIRGFDEFDV
jgi:hypothetical protein